jgi:bacterioferritin-associated ferredoxin
VYVCICYAVTEHDVLDEIACGATDAEAVASRCGAGTSCGSCVDRICSLLRDSVGAAPMSSIASAC